MLTYTSESPFVAEFASNPDYPSPSYSPDDQVTALEAKRFFTEIGSFRTDQLGDLFNKPVYFDHGGKKQKKNSKNVQNTNRVFSPLISMSRSPGMV